ncbi:VDE lipocalin domain-containing protein [Aureococcus anophagefferens]|nr:VDE lipocalin domain-containing protein [Aureococcus anophagefferens]
MDFDAPLPYGGDMQLAVKAADRPAIRRLMAERNAKERGFASAAEEAAANAPVRAPPGMPAPAARDDGLRAAAAPMMGYAPAAAPMGFAPPAAAPPVVAPGPGDPDDATTWDGLFSEIVAEVCDEAASETEVEESEVPGAAAAAAAPAAVEAPAAAELEAPEPAAVSLSPTPASIFKSGRARYAPEAFAYLHASVHHAAADFKKAPETLTSVGDLMAALKPHVDERRYEATLDAAAWADAAAALEDAALAKTLFLPIAGAARHRRSTPSPSPSGAGALPPSPPRARSASARTTRAAKLAEKASKKDATKATKDAAAKASAARAEADRREAEARLGADKKERKRLQQQEKRQRQAEKKRLAADAAGAAAPLPYGGDLQEAIKRKDRDAVRLLMADRGARGGRAGASRRRRARPPRASWWRGPERRPLARALLQENEVDMATLALLDDADFEEMLVDAATRDRVAAPRTRPRRGAAEERRGAAEERRGAAEPQRRHVAGDGRPRPRRQAVEEGRLPRRDDGRRGRVRLPHGRPREKDRGGRPVVFDVKTNKKGRLNAVNVALDRSPRARPAAALADKALGALRKQREDNDAKRRAADDAKKAAAASAQEKRLAAKQQRLEDVNRKLAEEAKRLELEKRALAREREQLRELKAAQAAKLDAKKAKAEKAAEKKREDR